MATKSRVGAVYMWLSVIMSLSIEMVPVSAGHGENIQEASGADFLRSVISRLQTEREHTHAGSNIKVLTDRDIATNNQHMEIMGPTPVPPPKDAPQTTASSSSPAMGVLPEGRPAFTRQQLAALYSAALQKGSTLDLGQLFGENALKGQQHALEVLAGSQPQSSAGTVPGYYYYFYPIKSFMKNLQAEATKVQNGESQDVASKPGVTEMVPTTMMLLDATAGDRRVEPLFVAMASFIGMALMFVFSVLFLPRFGGTLRAGGVAALRHVPDDMMTLTRFVLEAVDDSSCRERIACEASRLLRGVQISETSIRYLDAILPAPIRKLFLEIRSLAKKKKSCSLIKCKKMLSKFT